jgi:ERCC4-type nuclease
MNDLEYYKSKLKRYEGLVGVTQKNNNLKDVAEVAHKEAQRLKTIINTILKAKNEKKTQKHKLHD